ncbi:MAG: hypothetical protein WC494_03790 [Candidatus Pacearchaeota archaeon]
MTRGIISLVRLNCQNSIKLAKAINSPIITIPIYDLISRNSGKPNKIYHKIKSSGGIHAFLNYNGNIILSLIMRDEVIWKFSPEKYAEIINGIKPNFYTTVDGGTYQKQDKDSMEELVRLSTETKELLDLCPGIKPIGHVKGCNSVQIKLHLNFLKKLGINLFLFHVGDFFRNGDENVIQQAKHFCSLIKNEENTLLVYGLGSPKRMLEFSFCDLFITYSHFVNAKHRIIFRGSKRYKSNNLPVYEAALHNFKEFSSYLKNLSYQTKLFTGGNCKWEEAQQEVSFVLQNPRARN